MLFENGRKAVIQSLIESLEHIASPEYNRRVWVEAKGPEADAFDDAVNNYYSEADDILNNRNLYGISNAQYQSLYAFHMKFDEFVEDNDEPDLFIDTPEWKEIMEMAKGVLDAFGWKKGK